MSEQWFWSLEQLLELNAVFEQIEPNWRQNYERYKSECETEAQLQQLLLSRSRFQKPRQTGPREVHRGVSAEEVRRLSANPDAQNFNLSLDTETLLYDLVIYF